MQGPARTWIAALLGAALAAGTAGCEKAGGVRLVPIFPDESPDLLADLGIQSLEVTLVPQGEEAGGEQKWVTVERGERLSLALEPGVWKAEIRGMGDGAEVCGETVAFEVEAGADREIPFFLGEVGAFNLARLEPADVAGELSGLAGHTATLYQGQDGWPRILVAGGSRGGEPSADAFVIDPVRFVIERLPSLGCARTGHTAVLVDVAAGRRVVLAGGDGQCGNELDVFDTAAQTFALVPVCGVTEQRPAVAEVERVSGELVQTGRVIAPGNPRCVVDVFTGDSQEDVPEVETGPDAPNYAVANSQGQVLIVTPQRFFVDEAVRGGSCIEGGSWLEDAIWLIGEERRGGHLIFLGNDQFLLAGGRLPGGEDPADAWTIVSLKRDCELSRVLDGVRPGDPPPAIGFALVDVGSADSLALLLAGGLDESGQATDRVSLLIQPTQAAAPTIHDLANAARERPVRLRFPRAGAAAVATPDGNTWLLGGGGAEARPEIFVGGAAFSATWDDFERRKPTMRLAWILDNGDGAPDAWFETLLPDLRDQVVRRMVTEFYLGLRTMVLLAASSDRGVDVDDLGVGLGDLASSAGCGDPPMPISVVAAGDLADVDLPGSVVQIPDEGQGGVQADILAEVDNIFAQLGQDRSGCTWRQFFGRAFDGVKQAGTGSAGAVDLSTGITLVLLAARDDDCSQGVFDGGSFVGVPPQAGTLADYHCTVDTGAAADEFDAYFGLPPGDLSAPDLGLLVEEMSWDPRDAIFAYLGSAGEVPAACDSQRYGSMGSSRRTRETLAWLDGNGSRTAEIDLCGVADGADLGQRTDEVVELVRGQLPLQACVSLAVAGVPADYDSVKGEYVPVPPEDGTAQAVAGNVRDLCRAITVEQAGADEGYFRAIPVDLTGCRAGTDSDRQAGCATDESGWLVRADQLTTVLGTVSENVEFVCIP